MQENSRLSHMILRHWQEHRPQMVEELRSQNLLEQTLAQAEEQTAELLYELVSVQKMQYQTAWEMATREWAFLPTEAPRPASTVSSRSPKKDPPATSE
jgi:acyl carrier protein phosphodiesterase